MTNQTLTGAVRLDGRIAIVTGGTQGLGEAIASDFVERGVKGIVICGRPTSIGPTTTLLAIHPALSVHVSVQLAPNGRHAK